MSLDLVKQKTNGQINRREQKATRKKISFTKEVRQNKGLYLMLIPFFSIFFLMTILPILVATGLSFTYYNMFQTPQWRGLLNFVSLLLNDDVFYIALKNTLLFALMTGPLSYLLCFIFAWLVNELGRGWRVLLTFMFYAPSISSSVYFIWQFLFSGDSYGLVNGFLMNLGILQEPVQWFSDPKYNLWILMLVQLWMSLGTGFLAFIAGFQCVDRSLYEAGAIDGIKSRFHELIYITIPMVKPQLIFGAIMQISTSFSVSTISMQLCGYPSTNYSAHTLVLHIMDYGTTRYEMGYACAISVVLFVLVLLFKEIVDIVMKYVGDS